jgi:hypothetical protein
MLLMANNNGNVEPTEDEKRDILKALINEHEIMMCFDGTHFRPLWKEEYDVNFDVMSDADIEAYLEKYQPYEATENDIDIILEYGLLDWKEHQDELYVLIWW